MNAFSWVLLAYPIYLLVNKRLGAYMELTK